LYVVAQVSKANMMKMPWSLQPVTEKSDWT